VPDEHAARAGQAWRKMLERLMTVEKEKAIAF
jgi:hypothetical protein